MNELGVDVASFQHPDNAPDLPWDALINAGVRFVIVKITDGGSRVDGQLRGYANPYAARDVEEARAHGLGVAVYHFLHAASPVQDQYDLIRAHLPQDIGSVWIDAEEQGFDGMPISAMAAAAHDLLAMFPSATFPLAGLYANLNTLALMSGSPWDYPLWLADPSHPDTPARACVLHQFGKQTIGGVEFDVDRFYGTDAQFSSLFGVAASGSTPTPVPPAPSPPEPAPAPPPSPEGGITAPQLQEGSLSGAVRNAQRLLNVHNANLAVDGSFGPATKQAVENFQRIMGLVQDGVVGPVTWSTLDTFG